MKTSMRNALFIVSGLIAGFALCCLLNVAGLLPFADGRAYPEECKVLADSPLLSALNVARCIKEDDFSGLGDMIHPEKGVAFTPMSTVDPENDLTFSAAAVSAFETDKQLYLWGVADGEGAPIRMTPLDYMRRYVGDRDYVRAPITSVGFVVRTGNREENVLDVFPKSDYVFVELHIPQLDPKWEGMDWSSLKVVFAEYSGELKVVALIHSEWTM